MSNPTIKRRDFLKTAAGTAAIGLAPLAVVRAATADAVRIDEPFHGAVLNHRHGKAVSGGLEIGVSGVAPVGKAVTVNGAPAERRGDKFNAKVVLREHETDITARAAGGEKQTVRVVWDRYSEPRYRFSVDDNSFFLRDIAQKKYASLFDSWYLDIYRKLNKKYGAKFVLNIYYATADGFTLPDLSDRYKGEWTDNADWLSLAFHAHADKPDRPYQDAPPEKLIADFDKVAEQIVRFAGEATYSPPTVIHWGMIRPTAFKPLYERGVRVLSGFFSHRANVGWDINYRIDDKRSEYLSKHDAMKDFDSGIVFSKCDIVCNNTPIDRVAPTLEPVAKDPNTAEIMDLFTHEQYFWPFYTRYIPDHAQRLDTTIRWVTERGYKPVLFHKGFLGGRV